MRIGGSPQIEMRGRSFLPFLVSLVAVTACGSSTTGTSTHGNPATSTPTVAAFSVTSSILDGASLSDPVAWTVTATAGLSRVDFLVDGAVKWTEYNAPYFFNDDGNLLHPWLLGAGPHLLTTRAVTTSGAQASSSAHVTVAAGPQVPATLVGTFTRSVTAPDYVRTARYRAQEDINIGQAPDGTWTAHFQPNGLILFDDPKGSGGSEALSATPAGTLTMGGPVNWLVPKDRWGNFCVKEAPGQYHWSIAGRTLTITGDEKKCADRDSVFIGNWSQS
jgi:hypothetical protein